MTDVYAARGVPRLLETTGAWALGLLWILPLVYALQLAVFAPPSSYRRTGHDHHSGRVVGIEFDEP